MGDLATQALLKEIRSINKGFSKSSSSPTRYFVGNVPAGAVTKFSLPSRCAFVRLISATAFNYAPISCNTEAHKAVTAATAEDISGFFDLSGATVFVAAAGSGATIFALVQAAPDA